MHFIDEMQRLVVDQDGYLLTSQKIVYDFLSFNLSALASFSTLNLARWACKIYFDAYATAMHSWERSRHILST